MARNVGDTFLWQVLEVSVRGSSHERMGLPCQDAWNWVWLEEGQSLIIAVSDGAGSSRFSEKGSQLATKKVVEHLLKVSALRRFPDEKEWREAVFQAAQAALKALEDLAKEENQPLREYACTLLVVVINPAWIAGFQIGDGAIVFQGPEGPLQTLFPAEKGEYLNETIFLTSKDSFSLARVAFRQGAHQHIACFTDGISLLALQMPQETPHEPFFKPLFDYVDSQEVSLEEKRQELYRFFTSEKVRRRTDDDITLILVSRRQEMEVLRSPRHGLLELGRLLDTKPSASLFEVKNQPTLSALILSNPVEAASTLARLLAQPPSLPSGFDIQTPTDEIQKGSKVVGYLLPKPPTGYYTLEEIAEASKRVKRFGPSTFDYGKLIDLALRFLEGVTALHQQGWWVGPLSKERILFSLTGVFIANPSFLQRQESPGQVSRKEFETLYLRPASLSADSTKNADYTFLYGEEDEVHGVFTVIFRLLMNGYFPYEGEPSRGSAFLPYEELVRRKCFVYDPEVQKIFRYYPPTRALNLTIIPYKLQRLLIQAFSPLWKGPLPTLSALQEALLEMRGQLRACGRYPTHVYPAHLAKCPWCERRTVWGFDPFPSAPVPASSVARKPLSKRRYEKLPTAPPSKPKKPFGKTSKKLPVQVISTPPVSQSPAPSKEATFSPAPAASSTPALPPAQSEAPPTTTLHASQPIRPKSRARQWLWVLVLSLTFIVSFLIWLLWRS